ncbi:MAG: tetratricopeptide repeat protein [Gemmatimonadetes bacterium]|nr:tetratricopeptide repeat protein [Gemmatimonadota bacterium]
MSLIADALRAAQTERAQPGVASGTAQRVIAGTMLRSNAGARVVNRRPFAVPKPIGLASAMFGLALVAAAGVVAVAPGGTRPRSPVGETLRQATSRTTALPTPRAEPVETSPAAHQPLSARVSVGPLDGSRGSPAPPAAGIPAQPTAAAAISRRPAPMESAGSPSGSGQATMETGGRFHITVSERTASATDLLAEAVAAHRRGELSRAVPLYERVLAVEPRNGPALRNLGAAHEALGQPTLARDAFRRAIDVNARDASAWSSLGSVLSTLGQAQAAQAALGEAIRLDASNSGAKVNLANLYLGEGLASDARRLLDEVVLVDPVHPEAHYALGRLLEGTGERREAIERYRSFLEHAGGRFPQQETLVRTRIQQLVGN